MQTLDQYLAQRISKKVVQTAQTMRQDARDAARRTSARSTACRRASSSSIWGLESNFGRFSGVRPTIATLATLAYDPRRSAMFRQELFDALKILDSGDVEPAAMRGSWAGALGQPQFMPSSFLLYAQDFDGDGKRDIWKSHAGRLRVDRQLPLGARLEEGADLGARSAACRPRCSTASPKHAPLQTDGCLARRQMTVPLPLATWKKLGVTTVPAARCRRPTSRRRSSRA